MRTSQFLDDVKRHISVPTYQPRFEDTDIINLANDEQRMVVVPMLTGLREEIYVTDELVTFPAATGKLRTPERAIGLVVRDIWLSSVQSTNFDDYKRATKLELEEILNYRTSDMSGGPYGWYAQGNDIHVHPPSTSATYGWLKYLQRPSDLVLEERTCTIVSIGSDTVTVDAVPDNIVVGSYCDITEVNPHFGIACKDLLVSATSDNQITFSGYDVSNPLTGFSVGDIVSTKRETSVLQMPEDANHVLVWAVCCAIESAIGVPQFIDNARKELQSSIQACRDLCSPRSEGSRPKIVNPRGLLRSNSYARKFPTVTA